MRNKWWIVLILFLVLPGLLMTVSCAKKTVKAEEEVTEVTTDEDTAALEAERARRAAEEEEEARRARERELEEQRRREAEEARRLAEEARRREIQRARSMFVNEDIYFEFDSSALTGDAVSRLKRKAAWLEANGGVDVMIEGHCDERGTNEYNMALGERRAQSAKAFLENMGVDASRLSTISYGEERPVDPGHNEEAWAKNRRAHFDLQ